MRMLSKWVSHPMQLSMGTLGSITTIAGLATAATAIWYAMANSSEGSISEANRQYWDSQIARISKEPWILNLTEQILTHLRSERAWLGITEDAKPFRVLDYACGFGVVSMALAPYVSEIRGVDVSGGMVEQYNKTAKESGKTEAQMHAARGDLLSPEGTALEGTEYFNFDLVVMSMALHHIDKQQELTDRLVERVKPGGSLLIIDWKPDDSKPHEGDSEESKTFSAAGGFDQARMSELLKNAGCKDTDYQLAKDKSEVPPDPTGWKHMFFAKGVK